MMKAGRLDIAADRWVACVRTIVFEDLDLTDATFSAQVRQINDLAGSPLVSLSTVSTSSAEGVRFIYGGSATVSDHIIAGRLAHIPYGLDLSTPVFISLIGIRINETTMEGLPFPDAISAEGDRGEPVKLAWDLHITPSGGTKDKYVGGQFVVLPGATQ